jgi:predicted DNA-binding transcriptional regulator YafY
LPDRLRGRVQAVQGALTFTPLRGFGELTDPAALLAVSAAAQDNRRVWMRYQGTDDQTERSIDPYGVVHHRGRWYIVGWCHLRDDVRMFRLDRVLAHQPLDETFARPLDFDCAAYVLDSLARVPWGWPVEVFLEISLDEARRRIPPDIGTLEETVGGVLLRTQADPLEWMARQLVLIDCPFRIEHPPELREAVRKLARQLSRQARRGPRRLAQPDRTTAARAVPQSAAPTRLASGVAAVQTR